MFKNPHEHHNIKWLIGILAVFFIFIVFACVSYLAFEKKFAGRIYPGVIMAGVDLGGKTVNEAVGILNQKTDIINQNGITFEYDYLKAVLYPVFSSVESDLAYEIINFKIEESANNAIDTGRDGGFWHNLKTKLYLLVSNRKLPVLCEMNENEVKKFLDDNFSNFNTPPKNATLVYVPDEKNFIIEEEVFGQILNYDEALNSLKNRLFLLDNRKIELGADVKTPEIYKKDCFFAPEKAAELAAKAPFNLKYEKLKWRVEKETLSDWLNVKINEKKPDEIIVGLDEERVGRYLKDVIAVKTDIAPLDAKFEIKDGRVNEFQASKDGLSLDIPQNIGLLESSLLAEKADAESSGVAKEIELIVRTIKSTITTDSINDMGIREIIGTGHSNFTGSPANRRHNIKNGSDTLNGMLIRPQEEFSLLKALGEVKAETGYLAELVIKGNKTIPEFGGGLCQVGTTMFRAVIASGLPVTMRRNHSYRVSYYEPAGMDATIYDPWPDFKFINDTPYYILIQSRIEGNDLYYDFWSTEDGRVSSNTQPVIYNIRKPEPTKMVETLDLEPGEKKCTESAHNGADAYFDYTVTYPENNPPQDWTGEEEDLTREERFSSHYIPWRAVCLVGVEELSDPPAGGGDGTASSTEEIVN